MACRDYCDVTTTTPKVDPDSKLITLEPTAMAWSNWLKNNTLKQWAEGTNPVVINEVWIGVVTTASDANNPGTEVVNDGYERKKITIARLSDIQYANSAAWNSFQAVGDVTGTVGLIAMTSQTGGNYMGFVNYTETTIADQYQLTVPVNNFSVTMP